MRTGSVLTAFLFAVAPRVGAQKLEALWYSVGGEESTKSFVAHAAQISIVAPQVFALDSLGEITGKVDPRVVAAAREKGVKLIPLVMNPGFDQAIVHRVLSVADARQRAIANLAALCQRNHFDGLQFDLENVNVADKDAFTSFVRESAAALHRVGCSISAAVVPRTGEKPGPSSYDRWMFDNWRGAYDYKALADALDFISYMTYAQHAGGSTPGPVAGYTWMEEALKYVLSLGVPPSKISLGIPSYVVLGVRCEERRACAWQGHFVRHRRRTPHSLRRAPCLGRPRQVTIRVLEQQRRLRVAVDRRRPHLHGQAGAGAKVSAPRLFRVGPRTRGPENLGRPRRQPLRTASTAFLAGAPFRAAPR
jgi:spore germination protein YaaH